MYLFVNAILGLLSKGGSDSAGMAKVIPFMEEHRMLGLGICMAACKAVADSARNIPFSTMLTSIARNGTECGIQVSGLGDEWFTAPAYKIEKDAIFFEGY